MKSKTTTKKIEPEKTIRPGRKAARQSTQPVEPEPEPDSEPENEPGLYDLSEDEFIPEHRSSPEHNFPVDEIAANGRVDDIVSFIEGIEGINEGAVRMHIYRYDSNKPIVQQTREDRVKMGCLEFNPSSWEDDIHACFPQGGRFYIEWRWVYNVFDAGERVRKAGSVEAGIHRRFDPLPVQVAPNPQQGTPSGVSMPTSANGAPTNREEIERQARDEIKRSMEWQMSMMGTMMNFVQGIPSNGHPTGSAASPPPTDPLIDKIKESVITAGLESFQNPVTAVRDRPLAFTDVVSNIGVALVNKLDPATVNLFVQNLVKPPDTAPAQNTVIDSPPIEPGATEADIVRHPLPATATAQERYLRVLKIIYEDLTTNAPVTDSVTALRELVEAVPEYKAITQTLIPLPVDKLKEQLLTGYSEQGQTAIKNTPTVDTWIANLKQALT